MRIFTTLLCLGLFVLAGCVATPAELSAAAAVPSFILSLAALGWLRYRRKAG